MTEQLDRIEIYGITAFGRHGVLSSERETGQTFSVDIVLWLPLTSAAKTDDLSATVDYSEVAAGVHEIVAGEPVLLIETLAARIADFALSFDLVHEVEVAVHKPQAPITVPFDDVVVRIRRQAARASAAARSENA